MKKGSEDTIMVGSGPRVLHLGKYFPPARGGIENFLFDLVHAQARSGLEPLALVHQHEPLRRTAWERSGAVPVCRCALLGSLLYAPLAPSYPAILKRVLRDFSPDVVHVHLPNSSAFWLLFLPPRKPIVIHWHADVVASKVDRRLALAYGFYRLFERSLLQRASAVIVTSHPYLESSEPLRDFTSKCTVIPLGMAPERLRHPGEPLRPSLPVLQGAPLVLSAGRFTYYKGFNVLIEAAAALHGVTFVIAGDGPLRSGILRRVESLGLSDRILLPGEVPDRELHALMAACDVFCLPSIERTEAFGMVLLEAMASGKPLLTTSISGSGTGWVNQHGRTGLVVPPGSASALAQAIREFSEDPQLRSRMGSAARSRFAEKFHIGEVARQIEAVYHSTFQTPPTMGW